jgi:hypothetical protein
LIGRTLSHYRVTAEVKARSDRLEVGLPVPLFDGLRLNPHMNTYAVTRDGQRFLALAPPVDAARGKIHVVTNRTSLLEKK